MIDHITTGPLVLSLRSSHDPMVICIISLACQALNVYLPRLKVSNKGTHRHRTHCRITALSLPIRDYGSRAKEQESRVPVCAGTTRLSPCEFGSKYSTTGMGKLLFPRYVSFRWKKDLGDYS
jgi:hypothetical protein